MLKITKLVVPVVMAGIIGMTSVAVAAAETQKPENAVNCLQLNRIQNTDIIDNKRIVFQSGVNDYYLNTLPYACHGLKVNDSFIYETSINELCHVDTIQVLDQTGPGVSSGASCGLGYFEPITKDQIKKLKESL